MQITRFSDYSLRVLMYLAVQPERWSTIAEIADQYAISKNHLMKVVQSLGSQGYVETARGKHGGIRLADQALGLSIGELVRQTEQDTVLIECFGSDNRCAITPACRLKKIFADAQEAFYQSLSQYTLEDLVRGEQRQELQELLAMPGL